MPVRRVLFGQNEREGWQEEVEAHLPVPVVWLEVVGQRRNRAREQDSDAVRPPLATLRVWAGAPRPPLAIPPSRFGQRALVTGNSSGEAAGISISLSLFPHLTSGAR